MSATPSVVVTGIGLVCPLGIGRAAVEQSLDAQRSGLRRITEFDTTGLRAHVAGIVDDYDGVFQRLNLEPGGHQIEIDVYPGVPPMDFDVYIEPGRTVTIHARP